MRFQFWRGVIAPVVIGVHFAGGLALAAESQSVAGIKPCEGRQASLISRQTINLPPPGAESEAELGQSMVSALQGDLMARRLVLVNDATFTGSYLGASYVVAIPAGELEPTVFKGKSAYAAKRATLKYNRDEKPRSGLSKPDIFLELDARDSLGLIGVFALGFATQRQPITKATFKVDQCLSIGSTGFRRELLYSGVSKGTITIQYREFINDLARPAFSQELKYDLADGTEIGFRELGFRL